MHASFKTMHARIKTVAVLSRRTTVYLSLRVLVIGDTKRVQKRESSASLSSNQDNDEHARLNHPAIDRWEKNVCVVPHSWQRKCSVSRRFHGLGASQTVQRVSCCGNGRSQ